MQCQCQVLAAPTEGASQVPYIYETFNVHVSVVTVSQIEEPRQRVYRMKLLRSTPV